MKEAYASLQAAACWELQPTPAVHRSNLPGFLFPKLLPIRFFESSEKETKELFLLE
jgi:hypothetical protein